MTLQCTATGAAATRALGARLAAALLASEHARSHSLLITLSGELGAGKTTLVGGLLGALGHVGPVRSPTYTLLEPYRLHGRDIVHCDLYRMRAPEELEDLGLRELHQPGTVLLVEWPDKAGGGLGVADLAVALAYAGAEGRSVAFEGISQAGRDLVDRL
ncbi:MAG: tRNA (adenosine(37)-N6)-threonylcarbamoyltransferase complex ATPase subunit type 1 TsaE [Steroidobacteraceae bacterium]